MSGSPWQDKVDVQTELDSPHVTARPISPTATAAL
eukprot:COSAG01_NODE_73101_length_251_cov_0.677632_1_plen_34_part_01